MRAVLFLVSILGALLCATLRFKELVDYAFVALGWAFGDGGLCGFGGDEGRFTAVGVRGVECDLEWEASVALVAL
jgi:hypothetical protein